MIPHIVLLISQLPDIVHMCFCTPDGPMDPTFQMKYVTAFSMFLTRDIKQKPKWGHPVQNSIDLIDV